jgi:phosphatidylglycerol:prolipoprotein diacylglycerol transferase
MYVVGIIVSYFLIRRQRRSREIGLDAETTHELLLYLVTGLIVGARIGYLVFYQYGQWGDYLRNPLEIIAVWHGGLSFHGGLIGALISGAWFCNRKHFPLFAVADSVIVTVPVGLGFGRIGNFINAELSGRITDVPWAMVFPGTDGLPRHPSQLYEAFFEGLILFALLWRLRKKQFTDGMMVVFFLVFYGAFRFFLEFFRMPDFQLGFVWNSFTMGQVLCILMVIAGGMLALYLKAGAGKQT